MEDNVKYMIIAAVVILVIVLVYYFVYRKVYVTSLADIKQKPAQFKIVSFSGVATSVFPECTHSTADMSKFCPQSAALFFVQYDSDGATPLFVSWIPNMDIVNSLTSAGVATIKSDSLPSKATYKGQLILSA